MREPASKRSGIDGIVSEKKHFNRPIQVE
jgi:hypothetical protein